MSLKFKLIIMLILLILIFPMRVNADEINMIYYFENDITGNDYLKTQEYTFCGNINTEERVFILISNLFDNNYIDINYVPYGTMLLSVNLYDDELVVNVNENIKNYGGSTYEVGLIKQILYTIFQFDDIKTVTLLINGKLDYLGEGSIIYKYDKMKLLEYN